MAEEYPIKIEGFRQMTYHASYHEPRIASREQLLQRSYESALKQAEKAKLDPSRHVFFLEDTSVIVDALSTSGQEIPGVDVKFWMDAQTFESLDSVLKHNGNNRTVTVRSDILLHIPETYRKRWGLEKSCIVFTGFQRGTVADHEYRITTNLVFPWLDSKTFNKWFVPDNSSVPLSLLPIDEANKYDFRRHAFLTMVDFLRDKGALTEEPKQISLAIDIAPTLMVCGFTCAGKTTIARYLIQKYGYIHIEASDFMYLNYYLRHDVSSDIKIAEFAEMALSEKPGIAAEKIARYMEDSVKSPTIISGFRSKKEIDWVRNYFQNRKQFLAFCLDAPEAIRFERHKKRDRDRTKMSIEEFKLCDEQQVRMGLSEIAEDVTVKTIQNDQGFRDFYEAFENNLPRKLRPLQKSDIELSTFEKFSDHVKLEDAIVIALLSRWEDDEDRKYYTTTEIARLISDIFPELKPPKHKDNVSRYFNQDFYALYEIEPTADENKRRYRLSNTGYGRAVQVYHALSSRSEGTAAVFEVEGIDE